MHVTNIKQDMTKFILFYGALGRATFLPLGFGETKLTF
jgi:hypothetical protein